MVEDKARDRVPSSDSARERNAVFRPQAPVVARMDFFNGLLWMQNQGWPLNPGSEHRDFFLYEHPGKQGDYQIQAMFSQVVGDVKVI